MSDWQGVPERHLRHLGFVYVITHIDSNSTYIGKKQFKKKLRRKPLKGKKRVRLDDVESDWRTYWGSSNALLDAIKKHGEAAFVRRIISVHDSKRELAYAELKLQVEQDVLNNPRSWNSMINVRLSCPVGDPIAFARKVNTE